MTNLNREKPKDLLQLLEQNYNNGEPLLTDAVLYRGTRIPDQTQGSFASDVMHATLLPQVAAGYTHNWDEKESFIGTYPVDRKTRFFADFGLEQALEGKLTKSYTVADVEKALTPLVERLAKASGSRAREPIEREIDGLVKAKFYEAGLPTRLPSGEFNRPKDLYLYRGRPDVKIRQGVAFQMEKVGPHNERIAKEVTFERMRNVAGRQMHALVVDGSPAAKAIRTIQAVAQRAYGAELREAHADKPLNEFLSAVAQTPLSATQEKLGKFAQALSNSLSPEALAANPRGALVADQIAKLDPDKATFADLAKASQAGKELQREGGAEAVDSKVAKPVQSKTAALERA